MLHYYPEETKQDKLESLAALQANWLKAGHLNMCVSHGTKQQLSLKYVIAHMQCMSWTTISFIRLSLKVYELEEKIYYTAFLNQTHCHKNPE